MTATPRFHDGPVAEDAWPDGGHLPVDAPPPYTDAEAEQLIARIVRHQQHAETIKQNAAALVKHELDRAAFLEMDPRLREWAEGRLRGSRRSVRTLEGVAGFVKRPARLIVEDERAAVRWAEERGEENACLDRRLDRSMFKPCEGGLLYVPTGEVLREVPGLDVASATESFYVKSGVPKESAAAESEADDDV